MGPSPQNLRLRMTRLEKQRLRMTTPMTGVGGRFAHPACSFVTDIATRNGQARCMRFPKTYFVYIMTNRSKTLYTGVTNNLVRRVREYKLGSGSVFASKYKLDRLVYFERFEDVHDAIEREKQIKGWLRIKKIALIVEVNPAWKDLSAEWFETHQFQPDLPEVTTSLSS
jgi:putative endonuclease